MEKTKAESVREDVCKVGAGLVYRLLRETCEREGVPCDEISQFDIEFALSDCISVCDYNDNGEYSKDIVTGY